MYQGTTTCPNCGWLNQPTDRMCGGCGKPLRQPSAPANIDGQTRALDWSAPAASPPQIIGAGPYAPDAPTAYAPNTATPYAPVPYTAYAPPATPLASAPPAPARRWSVGGCLLRGLFTLLILGVILAGLGYAGWSYGVRPALHTQVDNTLRSALYNSVDQLNAGLSLAPDDVPIAIPASQLQSVIQSNLPANAPVTGLTIGFSGGVITLAYKSQYGPGAITTHPQAVNGRVTFWGTVVDGPLSLIESGDETERALTDAFARLSASPAVTAITADKGAITFTVHR